MNNYKNLKMWQKSVDLTVKVYKSTDEFPKEETHRLTSQIRRCSVSIPSNITEESGRNTGKDFRNFLGYSHGPSYELETQLTIANKVGFLENEVFFTLQENIIENTKNELCS